MSQEVSTSIITSNQLSLIKSKKRFFEVRARDSRLQKIELVRCERDIFYWLWGDDIRHNGYVYTLDPHDSVNPIKKLPDKTYLREIVRLWLENPLLLIAKSRQLMLTWIISACFLWDAQFHKGRHIYFQSKKEEDADDIVRRRAGFILNHEPHFLWPSNFDPEKHITYCHINFTSLDSFIIGIPEGGDQIRSRVPSGLFSDESAFQPEFRESVDAMKPCLTGGGRFTAVSSANPGYFAELVNEK